MDRKSETNSLLCGRCGVRRPLAVVTSDSGQSRLCGACLGEGLGTRSPAVGAQAAALLTAILQPRENSALTALPNESSRQCARCGLTYAEFHAHGRAGCPECYIAFAPAVRQALDVLHTA